ncbi:putative flippase GtrA [Rhizobium leguminosarum]|uniref:GtrA family protein n=1 Tax=Rhizobium leguminosarum TaxID=384 RepID=UPI0009B8D09F|nr:GtrA family protein [Rhizobium leguminosarum]MDH6275170.1 putative flippase GtrA [Rhizobium leguminosarum]
MLDRLNGLTLSKVPFSQLTRYVLTGGMTFLLFLSISSAPKVFPVIPDGVATGLAVFLSGVFNFYVHYLFTFRSKRSLKATALRYLILISFNSTCAGFLADYLIHSQGLNSVAANVLCAFATTIFSYPAMLIFVM